MPDGNGLLFSVPGPNGSSHRVLDQQTGKTRTLLNVNYDQSNIDVSPDGKRLAFTVSDDAENPNAYITLLQVDTCQIVLLPKLVGNVSAWAP